MNYSEILAVIMTEFDSVEDFAYAEGFYTNDFTPDLGEMVEIEQVGGEGQGSYWYSVKHFVAHDVYMKVTGYYSSYNGTDFDDEWGCCEEVKPVSKMVTFYE